MKVFISQPMNGLSEAEILKKRERLFDLVRNQYGKDIELIDSYIKSPKIVTKGHVAMLGDSIALMADADLVVFARNWNKARGCKVEEMVAKLYDLPMMFEESLTLTES